MNKIVDKLFSRALDKAVPETWTTLDQDQLARLKDQFAELIVRECAEICMKEFDTGLLMAPQAPWIAKQIKEHFGVEK